MDALGAVGIALVDGVDADEAGASIGLGRAADGDRAGAAAGLVDPVTSVASKRPRKALAGAR